MGQSAQGRAINSWISPCSWTAYRSRLRLGRQVTFPEPGISNCLLPCLEVIIPFILLLACEHNETIQILILIIMLFLIRIACLLNVYSVRLHLPQKVVPFNYDRSNMHSLFQILFICNKCLTILFSHQIWAIKCLPYSIH